MANGLTRGLSSPPLAGGIGRLGLRSFGGRAISPPAKFLAAANLTPTVVEETAARWFEVSFRLPDWLHGDPTGGWFGPGCHVALQWSDDLRRWECGGWIPAPGKPPTRSGGWVTWHARHRVAQYWFSAIVDLTVSCDRQGKSITAIYVAGSSLPLDYPYAMPADATALQADLRTAGFQAATVEVEARDLSAFIANFTSSGIRVLRPTVSAGVVTEVVDAFAGTLPLSYPYTLPGDAAALQAAVRAAGYNYATVMVLGDMWTITLPDYQSSGYARDFSVIFTPGDPHATWDMFGNYSGENEGDFATGSQSNPRTDGASRREAVRGFARLAS